MRAATRENRFGWRDGKTTPLRRGPPGFTLVELLVVLGIISVLMATLLPALTQVRRQARSIVSVENQRQITAAVNCFASDGDGRYPPSVATIGFGDDWNWQEPTMLTGYLKRSPSTHRAMSSYLRAYIEDASVMFCPNAPLRYKYLQRAWQAGEDWDNPDTEATPDALMGAYCFYWNYIGTLGERRGLFRGPSGPVRASRESKIAVTDYFGYDHWRSLNAYGSCERFREAEITEGTGISSAYWSRPRGSPGTPPDWDRLRVKLHAGYIDGHVEAYFPSDTVPMAVICDTELNEPYTRGMGPGTFYLPRTGLR
ncbi:MAG: type II secretion system protein [Sedimentisphaerales bacterium]|nr:type II secretion system protein [Sedimentisphaerales bacterium]